MSSGEGEGNDDEAVADGGGGAGAFAAGFGVHAADVAGATAHAAANRVFEIRTYTAPPGKLDALKARFRDHTIQASSTSTA